MKVWLRRLAWAGGAIVVIATCFITLQGRDVMAADDQGRHIEVELTESFYRALRAEGTQKTYSTDKSEEYLRQIAVSSRYAVESNLKIIKQQDRIIQLLEGMQKK